MKTTTVDELMVIMKKCVSGYAWFTQESVAQMLQ